MTLGVLSPLTVDAVKAEAIRAHMLHKDRGGSILDPTFTTERRLAALGEEYGEVCRELTYDHEGDTTKLVKELIQLASVALTWVEFLEGETRYEREPAPSSPILGKHPSGALILDVD